MKILSFQFVDRRGGPARLVAEGPRTPHPHAGGLSLPRKMSENAGQFNDKAAARAAIAAHRPKEA